VTLPHQLRKAGAAQFNALEKFYIYEARRQQFASPSECQVLPALIIEQFVLHLDGGSKRGKSDARDGALRSKLIVVTDLGTFKAFRLDDDRFSSAPRLEPVDAYESVHGDDRISRGLSDQAGQFKKGAPIYASINDQSNGERHNIWLENERRSVKQIADRLTELLGDGNFGSCYFAAASEINNAIVNELPQQVRSKIEKNIPRNLVNAPRDEILRHFD
jgi:protein required for attachment to host cells